MGLGETNIFTKLPPIPDTKDVAVPEPHPWHPTNQLRWIVDSRGETVLQQLWRQLPAPTAGGWSVSEENHEWRDVPTEYHNRAVSAW